MNPKLLGFLRAVGTVLLFSLVKWLESSANLNGFVSAGTAGLIASLALMAEHAIEAKTGTALFGAVRTVEWKSREA